MQQPDVIIVQKQTALERYTRRPLNVDFLEYLEKAGQSLDSLKQAHKAHITSRQQLLSTLRERGLTWQMMNLDELLESGHRFFSLDSPEKSGFQPAHGLVIALGGDGTLLHASHYVGSDACLLGINSCPEHSVGHLCAANQDTFSHYLDRYFKNEVACRTVRRLHSQLSTGATLPLALNDVLFSNLHPAATSRYQIDIQRSGVSLVSEKQLSSGVWITGPAGSTAAISSYGLPRLPLTSNSILCAIREKYCQPEEDRGFTTFHGNGDTDEVVIFCRMRQALVCVDGPDCSLYLGFGQTVRVSMPATCALRLVIPDNASHAD